MNERSEIIAWIRGELVGPSRPLTQPVTIEFIDRQFAESEPLRRGPLAWRSVPDAELEEVLYFERESPHRKYGAGLLHPAVAASPPDQAALQQSDTLGIDAGEEETSTGSLLTEVTEEDAGSDEGEASEDEGGSNTSDDFEVTSPDIRHPSSLGISFCVQLNDDGQIVIRLPRRKRFFWQAQAAPPFALNGRYEQCKRVWTDDGTAREAPAWRRVPAVGPDLSVTIGQAELIAGKVVPRKVEMPEGSPLALKIEVFPRRLESGAWLLTVVLRNMSTDDSRESILYQTLFEVEVSNGHFEKYPESQRPFGELDADEQSLALLYRESATWGIGHGCAAGWDAEPGAAPTAIYADVMPAVELPSMTPDIEVDGVPLQLSMRALAALPDQPTGYAWGSLEKIASGYAEWIERKREEATFLPADLAAVANSHLSACGACLDRINVGITLLRNDERVRRAFRLANLAMLLQQIATKQLARRPLSWSASASMVSPEGIHQSPWQIFESGLEDKNRLGSWRAFQIAFLLMSLDGVRDGRSPDREIVDLIWFPTGGGKTEAYLAVMAFYMFHERLLMEASASRPWRDGTNVLMRYTLRMLTTQQFQRAASLICAMEYLRRNPGSHRMGGIPGRRFSLGLWIGQGGSPNKISDARTQLADFRRGDVTGNPLVLTECPWCRAEIGRYEGSRPGTISNQRWNAIRVRGITDDPYQGPLLHCPDSACEFGQEDVRSWLPVEVIDERIYDDPPSLVIATADKLAIIAFRPQAGALFGRRRVGNQIEQHSLPPGLIVQDELHLISGPLGTMYALYESIFERLCSVQQGDFWIKPKIIASTATIRGAADQVNAVYARSRVDLFPSPGLSMGDSFFGRYARDEQGRLRSGRLYLGIHANDYGSILTTQVRVFSTALFRPWTFAPEYRDAWWTLLTFYNSIRELGGARTLFDSDIRSRLKFMFNREGFAYNDRRTIRIIEELTSRLTQAEIVRMMDRLSATYRVSAGREILDACLASNIIEVGVDIDRLSLMGVIGQPKTTATYIQVTGRIGRRWWERAGLVLMIYSPAKSRDRSHFEQFHSYHRRLYERVEPASATPFAVSAIQRGSSGALIAWARQNRNAPVQNELAYEDALRVGHDLLRRRSDLVQNAPADRARSLAELERMRDELIRKWRQNPQEWEEFPQQVDGEYLMLWPGQFATGLQKRRGVVVPSSMRQVDRSAELTITQGYGADAAPATQPTSTPTPAPANPPAST
jgi:hypothetical protein